MREDAGSRSHLAQLLRLSPGGERVLGLRHQVEEGGLQALLVLQLERYRAKVTRSRIKHIDADAELIIRAKINVFLNGLWW